MAMNPMHERVAIAAAASAVAADKSNGRDNRANRGGRSIFSSNKSRGYEMVGVRSPIDHRLDVSEHVDELEGVYEDEQDDEQEINFSDVLLTDRSDSDPQDNGVDVMNNSRIGFGSCRDKDKNYGSTEFKNMNTYFASGGY